MDQRLLLKYQHLSVSVSASVSVNGVTPVRSELCQHLRTDSGVNRRKIN